MWQDIEGACSQQRLQYISYMAGIEGSQERLQYMCQALKAVTSCYSTMWQGLEGSQQQIAVYVEGY
jgi:hypothetical protein